MSINARGCVLEERKQKTHLEPTLTCILDDRPKASNLPLFSIKNDGAINAVSVSVDHYQFRYMKSQRKIRIMGAEASTYNELGIRWMYFHEIKPNEITSKLTGDMLPRNDQDLIGVLLFTLTFYRETDGREFSKRCTFYVDGDRIFSEKEFRDNEHFKTVNSELSRYLSKGLLNSFKNIRLYQKE